VFVLDTDHASELAYRSAVGLRLLNRLAAAGPEDAVITAITVEEQLRGRLAEIRRHHERQALVAAYARLVRQVELHAAWCILPWDESAAEIFE
jgi:predicted nucleic acid-binding protein